MLRFRSTLFIVLCALFGLSACGGGGGGGSTLPSTPSSPPSALQSVRLSIIIPAPTGAAADARRPAYVSSQTQSASISVNGGTPVVVSLAAGSLGCTTTATGRTCTTTVSAPVQTDTFAEKLYATTTGTGAVLSQGTISATIVAGQANVVNLTLSGVPASAALSLANPTPAQGTPATIGLTVTVKDAAGSAIIGGDPFASPITLTDSDTSGATVLSKTTLNSPNDAANLTIAYSGAALASPAVFGASGSGLNAANVATATLTPTGTPTTVTFNDYTTYGYDNGRTKFNPNSVAITPTSLASLHLAWQSVLSQNDYNTQTQPVLATNIGGHAGLLVVGSGGNGNMYAFDALTGANVWTKGLGAEFYNCNEGANGVTAFGVGGTAAYDPSTKSFYVVGNFNSAPNTVAQNTLYHMDAASGAILGSVQFAPNPVGPSELDFSHTSVTLSGNVAYVGTAATCDLSSWRGRIAEISVPAMQLINTKFTLWDAATQPWGGGGVWGFGGVSLDASGNVYTGVGNADYGVTGHGTIVAPFVAAPKEDSGNGDAFLQLSSNLQTVTAVNHPIPQSVFASTPVAVDLDLNGTPAIFKPNGTGCNTLAALQGKSGTLFIYDTTRISSGPISKYQLSPPAYTDEFLGDPAYSPVTGLLYSPVPVGAGSLYSPGMIAINPGCGTPSVTWHAQFGPDSDVSTQGYARSAPAVSAGGVVFVGTPCFPDSTGGCTGDLTPSAAARTTEAVRKPLICCAPPGSTTLGGAVWALNASSGAVLNGGKPLFTTPSLLRVPPTIDGNWIYVLDNAGDLYGLTIDPAYKAIALKYRTVDARSRGHWESQPNMPAR